MATHLKKILALAVLSITTPLYGQAIEETVVVADRVDTAADSLAVSVGVMDDDLISALGSATLSQLLKTQIGISATQNGGVGAVSGIRVRGQDTFRTKVLLDGIDVSDPSSPQIAPRMEHITSASIRRVEILRGTQGLLWGADAGGVISLTSQRGGDAPSMALTAERGGYGFETESLIATTGSTAGGELSLNINRMAIDGFNARHDDTVLKDRDGYENDSHNITYSSNVWRGWSATLSTREVDAKTDYDNCGRFDENFSFLASNDCSDGYKNQTHGVVVTHEGDNQLTRLNWSESKSDRDYFTDALFQFSLTGKNEQLSLTHNRKLNDEYALTLGLDKDAQSYDDGFGTARRRGNDGAFANLRRTTANYSISAALRTDDNDDFGRFTSWRITALRDTGLEGIAVKAAYGTGFRAPSPYEVGSNQSPFALAEARENPLSEEQSAGWEIGLRGERSSLSWDLTYFDQGVTDAIIYSYNPALFAGGYLQTDGKSTSQGVEAAARWAVNQRFSLEGFVSQLDSEDAKGDELPYRPEITAQLMGRYSGERSQWMLLARHTSDRTDEFGEELRGYRVVDASYRFNVTEDLEVWARAENLTDEDYSDVAGYRSPGRTLYAGISVSL